MYHYLMYVSYAAQPLTDDDLVALLEKCRLNNKKRNITGMLMFVDGKFIQVLEGAEKDINEMYDIILNDSRHKKISKIIEGQCVERNFKNWTMGFKSMSGYTLEDKKGFCEVENYFRNLNVNDSSHVTLIFLRLFYNKYYKSMELAHR